MFFYVKSMIWERMYCKKCETGKYALSMFWSECEQCPIGQGSCLDGVLYLNKGIPCKKILIHEISRVLAVFRPLKENSPLRAL